MMIGNDSESDQMMGEWLRMQEERSEILRHNWVTAGLIAVNAAVFVILEILGDTENAEFMRSHGADYPGCLLEDGEYWRLFTSTFLHFGIMHLLNNMIMLGAAGQILEDAIGHMKYFILYLTAGVGGSALSFLQMVWSGKYAVAAGASGAIFGIVGALLWIVILHRGHYKTLTTKGLIIMIVLTMYYGISSGEVDNWGHIGGLIGGFFMGMIFYRRKRQKY